MEKVKAHDRYKHICYWVEQLLYFDALESVCIYTGRLVWFVVCPAFTLQHSRLALIFVNVLHIHKTVKPFNNNWNKCKFHILWLCYCREQTGKDSRVGSLLKGFSIVQWEHTHFWGHTTAQWRTRPKPDEDMRRGGRYIPMMHSEAKECRESGWKRTNFRNIEIQFREKKSMFQLKSQIRLNWQWYTALRTDFKCQRKKHQIVQNNSDMKFEKVLRKMLLKKEVCVFFPLNQRSFSQWNFEMFFVKITQPPWNKERFFTYSLESFM